MIEVKNLFHKYSENSDYAVKNVSFEIPKGEIFGFLGPSGAGKSTVQKILIGILKKQKGSIVIDGINSEDLKKDFFEKIGVSFELPNMYSKLSGYENLKYYGGLFKKKTKDPLKLLESVGLLQDKDKKASDYSKGMKQRLIFARSLINDPDILFLDEPLSGLDPSTAKKLKEIIINEKNNGKTIFLTTHNMFVADELCDKVAFINNGEIVAMDTPKNLKIKYGNKSVKIEYHEENKNKEIILFLEKTEDKEKIKKIMDTKEILTIHSGEATLEEIFIQITGRGLS
ncbi:ABC transporter ATP-binding protein [Oceanotoga sp. DSM 15011]|jgi:fluoroquinolone transport system ATP-binding protein|uniref:Fluoroquinolone transport system ATP-binding protein n=1 Tax=Oceanotoga teriensis TaxID=515440 RepID=A0AA45C6B8_9BACT|nr:MULTISPECIES: ABC transporter ATP-binding protein [Oceanotoga]MDO7975986.1 ABC transporter ATP-binding protein [Oceanotoga teriensis]PWJ92024.1 fluoroquinolone transport system ATP-binding protein [Oceanotoga teriensis]UYO99024.1 ABC transporter ATP-binding protein [Oceanotoga sp. DSM 15011]